jgi:hypothetical protein
MGRAGGMLFRGYMWRLFVVMFIAMGVFIALLFVPGVRGVIKGWMFTGALLVCMAVPWVLYHRAARRLVAAGYRMCVRCRGPLPGEAELGRCPACDWEFDIPEIRAEFEVPFSLMGQVNTPAVLRRYRGCASVGGIMATGAALMGILQLNGWFFMVAFISLMAGGLVLVIAAFILERRTLARVRRGNLLVCLGCEYSLENSGSEGVCPECGRAFEIEEVRRDWVRCLRRWERAE